jgi:phytoene synthase
MDVEQAYAEVERLTRARAKNFAYGIMVLPKPKRRAIAAIYAFAREVDDIADGPLPAGEKRSQLEALRESLDARPTAESPVRASGPGEAVWGNREVPPGELRRLHAMHVALADARSRYPLPRPALEALVDGGLQDTMQSRYATIDELLDYCRKVAGAVGVACVSVYGSDDVAHAERLGLALQLINIMRDVREDWQLGRVYLPQDELAAHGVSEEDIAAGRVTSQWRALMHLQAERARHVLAEGRELLSSLDRRSRLCVATFAGLYEGQLDRIERNGYDVFRGSCRLPVPAKLAVVARGLVA